MHGSKIIVLTLWATQTKNPIDSLYKKNGEKTSRKNQMSSIRTVKIRWDIVAGEPVNFCYDDKNVRGRRPKTSEPQRQKCVVLEGSGQIRWPIGVRPYTTYYSCSVIASRNNGNATKYVHVEKKHSFRALNSSQTTKNKHILSARHIHIMCMCVCMCVTRSIRRLRGHYTMSTKCREIIFVLVFSEPDGKKQTIREKIGRSVMCRFCFFYALLRLGHKT